MKESKELMWVLFTLFRYPAAVVVAFMASMATIIYLPGLFQNDDSDHLVFFWFFCMGLVGVAAGSFCLPRNYRWIGSFFLLFLGLGFTLCMYDPLRIDDSQTSEASIFIPFVPLGVGGIIPPVIHYLLRSKSESKLLTEKEALALVVSGAFLAVAIFWLSFL